MSTSLYYKAEFEHPLSANAKNLAVKILAVANQHELAKLACKKGGEGISFYPINSLKKIEGSTKLPHHLFEEDIDDYICVFEHWTDTLAALRLALPHALWSVQLDADELLFNAVKGQYEVPAK
ncbi:hypothetical protein [Allohahella sp. A8]|uniref:hypothetical protein n=1 Tax=Allohahella sp. A8 TaxID=3141461 RepID=UPI003A80962B